MNQLYVDLLFFDCNEYYMTITQPHLSDLISSPNDLVADTPVC